MGEEAATRIVFATDGSPEAKEPGHRLTQFPAPDDAEVAVVSEVAVPMLPIAAAEIEPLARRTGHDAGDDVGNDVDDR